MLALFRQLSSCLRSSSPCLACSDGNRSCRLRMIKVSSNSSSESCLWLGALVLYIDTHDRAFPGSQMYTCFSWPSYSEMKSTCAEGD